MSSKLSSAELHALMCRAIESDQRSAQQLNDAMAGLARRSLELVKQPESKFDYRDFRNTAYGSEFDAALYAITDQIANLRCQFEASVPREAFEHACGVIKAEANYMRSPK